MNKKYRMYRRGFTLIEFLIYISIVSIVLFAAGSIGLNVLLGKIKFLAREEVVQNTRFAFEKMAGIVRNAQAINAPAPGTSAFAISLQVADVLRNPTVFDLSNGTVRIQEGSGAHVLLTSSEVVVTNLEFSNISYPNTSGTVRIQMRMKFLNSSGHPEYEFEKTFYTTANIRKN